MAYLYAQLNENNICIGLSQLKESMEADNLVPIETYNKDLLGMIYNSREWKNPPKSELEPELYVESEIVPAPGVPSVSLAEIAQMINDLKIDLLIAEVIDNV